MLTDGRDGRHNFTQLQLVQDGGLSGSVETDHENTHLLLAEKAGDCGPGEGDGVPCRVAVRTRHGAIARGEEWRRAKKDGTIEGGSECPSVSDVAWRWIALSRKEGQTHAGGR